MFSLIYEKSLPSSAQQYISGILHLSFIQSKDCEFFKMQNQDEMQYRAGFLFLTIFRRKRELFTTLSDNNLLRTKTSSSLSLYDRDRVTDLEGVRSGRNCLSIKRNCNSSQITFRMQTLSRESNGFNRLVLFRNEIFLLQLVTPQQPTQFI